MAKEKIKKIEELKEDELDAVAGGFLFNVDLNNQLETEAGLL